MHTNLPEALSGIVYYYEVKKYITDFLQIFDYYNRRHTMYEINLFSSPN